MGAPRPSMQDVVLVDDAARAAAPDGPPGPEISPSEGSEHPAGAPAGIARPRSVRRWWSVAAALALVAAAGAAVADRRESTRLAALADVPGILAPFDGPVSALWRSDDSRYTGLTGVAGRLVGVEDRPDGSINIVALDRRTGETIWRTAARPPAPTDTWATCASPAAGRPIGSAPAARVVACVVVDKVSTHENAAGLWPYSIASRLLVLDATTGAVRAEEPTEPSTSVAAIGTDLLISHIDAGARVHVTRAAADGTAARWTFTSPEPLPEAASGRPEARVLVVGDLVVVDGGSGWVLSAGGDVIRSWTLLPGRENRGRVAMLTGGRMLAETGTVDAGARDSAVIDLGTGVALHADGFPIAATPDDGSLAGLVLAPSASGQDLVAHDVSSGRPRWAASGAAVGGGAVTGRLAVIDGRVIRSEAGELRSIDGRTGKTVWVTPIDRPAQSRLFSDGRLILRTKTTPGRGLVLAAYGLDDGRQRWQTDIADDLNLFAIDGELYGQSRHGLVALG